jgi:hypothetical protein
MVRRNKMPNTNQKLDSVVTDHWVSKFIEECVAAGAAVVRDQRDVSVIFTTFNPLTDSDVVLEIDFEYHEVECFTVESQMRDHDGDGDNIPHSISSCVEDDEGYAYEHLRASECVRSIGGYVAQQSDELSLRVRLNTEKLCATALAAAFEKALQG